MRKGQLLSPLTTSGAFIGIIGLIVVFLAALSLITEPKTNNAEKEVENYGNFFINNYLIYEVDVDGERVSMSDLILLYHYGDENEKTKYKTLIHTSTSNLFNALFPSEEQACFSIFIDGNAKIKTLGECKKNKILAENIIPTNTGKITIILTGKS